MTRNLEPVFPCRKYILGRKSQLQHPISASQLLFGYKQRSRGYIGRELERATNSPGSYGYIDLPDCKLMSEKQQGN